MLRAYKYRIYPTGLQRQKIDATFGVCRLVYNLGLEIKNHAYYQQQKRVSAFDLCYDLIELKKAYSWIADVDSQALQAAIKVLDKAFANYFRNLKNGTIDRMKKAYIHERTAKGLPVKSEKLFNMGKPKFKSKNDAQSFSCPNNTRKIDWINSTLTIPKIKDIPIVLSRTFTGTIKTVTISRTPTGKYFASILVDNKKVLPIRAKITPETTIGIDMGISTYATLSDGIAIENPRYLHNSIARLKILQRRASRKVKGSANRKKGNLKVAIQHETITNQKQDFLHKLTTQLVRESQATLFCVESLSVANMVRNHNLAQAISDASWGEFFHQLDYKCDWYGKTIQEVGAFYPSSKTCSVCTHVNKGLKLSDRIWTCENCHSSLDRDDNASQNIKSEGYRIYSGKGIPVEPVEPPALVGAKKQEVSTVRYDITKNNNKWTTT